MSAKVKCRLRVRLSYAEWSRAIDKDGFAAIRKWVADTEQKLSQGIWRG